MNPIEPPPGRPAVPLLLDERSEPSLRRLVGRLLAGAREADFAVARIRLEGIDLTPAELSRVQRCRVLVGRLDAGTFADAEASSRSLRQRRENLRALQSVLESGRVEIRAAGRHLWAPDFSILRGETGYVTSAGAPATAVALVGAHYFARPGPTGGPALTCAVTDPDAVTRARRRFDELWALGYDVGSVVRGMLDRWIDVRPAASEGTDG